MRATGGWCLRAERKVEWVSGGGNWVGDLWGRKRVLKWRLREWSPLYSVPGSLGIYWRASMEQRGM